MGTHGTPMAMVLDANGRIASPLAAGAIEVMDFANGAASATDGSTA
jgi:hypothetical protein